MAFITLDFETFYRSRKQGDFDKYSLKTLTYEEYIFHPEFDPYMVGIKIDTGPTTYFLGEHVEAILHQLFKPGNTHTLLAHNVLFDGAILHWHYGLSAGQYLCTQSMSQALWNQHSASLAALAERLFPDDPSMRKGHELVSVDGIKFADMSPTLCSSVGGYCVQDVDLTFAAFAKMVTFFPPKELDVINIVSRWFIQPKLGLDVPKVTAYLEGLVGEMHKKIAASGTSEKVLASDIQFARFVLAKTGIEIPKIPSPTLKKPENMKLALAKDDLEFLLIRKEHPEFKPLWDARIAVSSNGERNRSARLLKHVQKDGTIAVPLKYSGAHTHRLSGTNSVNFQNFKRKSELRKSLLAPKGKLVYVADLANIESRKLAWFAQERELLEAFKLKEDLYSKFASSVYERPVDRKRTVTDPITGEISRPDELEGFIGKVCILGLGYGMGPATFQRTLAKGALGGPQVFFDMDRCTDIVYNKYRKQYKNIAASWKTADAIIREMANPKLEPFVWNGLTVEFRRIRLPSGLYLNYPGLRAVKGHQELGQDGFEYWNGKFWKNIYGGLFIENIIQALSRITMTDMVLDIDEMLLEYNGEVVLTVHDEIVAIADDNVPDEIMGRMIALMRKTPPWCSDGSLVLDAEGGYDICYSK